MDLSLIQLDDAASVNKMEGGRSIAYFCREKPARVSGGLVEQLKQAAEQAGGKNVRLCLHDGPDATFHNMIIVERKSGYYRAHRRPNKDVTYHMIEGTMGAFVFDEKGQIEEACLLEVGKNFIYSVDADRFRVTIPISDLVIFHEASPGPFVGEGDSVYPIWAPDGNNENEAKAYTAKLLAALPS